MAYYIVTFRSVTHAQRGERALHSSHIRCTLGRTPRWMEEQGCGYALRVYCEDISLVLALLRRENILIRRVYRQQQEGTLEVVEE